MKKLISFIIRKFFSFITSMLFSLFKLISYPFKEHEDNSLLHARVLHKKYGFGTIYYIDDKGTITIKLDYPITESTDSKSVYIIAKHSEFSILN